MISLELASGLDEKSRDVEKDPREKKKELQVEKKRLLAQAEAGAVGRQELVTEEPLAKAVAGKQKQEVGEGQQTEGAAVYRGQMKNKVVEQRKPEQIFEEPVLESH